MSCNFCFNSIMAPVADPGATDSFKCVGNSTGIPNCVIGQNGTDANLTGCKVCTNGFYIELKDKDGSPGVKVGVCLEGGIQNCHLYDDINAGESIKCKACQEGFALSSAGICDTESLIKKCQYMSYDSATSKAFCYVCNTGYGLSDDKLQCLTPSENDACINGVTTEAETCAMCSFYTGYFSTGLKSDDPAKQICKFKNIKYGKMFGIVALSVMAIFLTQF